MSLIARTGWPGNLIALLAGLLTPLAFAPFGLWPVLLLGVALLYHGLSRLSSHAALWRGWCYGFGMFIAGTSWVYVSIHDYGSAPAPLAGLLTIGLVAGLAFFFGLFAWLWVKVFRRTDAPLSDALAFAALWIAQELFRGWFLTGFPWLYAGYSQLSAPLAGLAPLGGVWLLSFVVVLTAALLSRLKALSVRPAALLTALLLIAAPWIAGQWLKGHAWTSPAGAPLKTLLIQGNVAQELKWNPAQLNAQLALYRDLTVEHIGDADLVVWPETAVPVLKEMAAGYLADMARFAGDHQAALITGLPLREPNGNGDLRYYNGITVVGQGEGTYLKQKLVPFGEYVPLQEVLRGLIAFFDLPMSDFARGPADQPPLLARSYRIAPFICYEVVYPEFAADLAAQSELLLTVSNDTWFGHSIGPLQHLQMAQMRALEAGRWMIRATNNGVTALIAPDGQVKLELPQFRKGVLRGSVTPMQGLTPYLKWRIWPLAVLCVAILAFAIVARRRSRKL
ncbi:apolipoprotein N-acyltransferase [Pseudomonas matsuisoli]|uniref:Apolipoprotein N-acyltransferase n=1 Tax=Pseudomonas matsuisoli TaxID=1515666 RepID=A0A917UYM7_9PSED|nr:apolipoprotein N-acyltransferase [Pseudomonas matsuisoli]GGJ97081.1 apolipoprotein N-acyltransferase [Pseudomonas matsuisoli]